MKRWARSPWATANFELTDFYVKWDSWEGLRTRLGYYIPLIKALFWTLKVRTLKNSRRNHQIEIFAAVLRTAQQGLYTRTSLPTPTQRISNWSAFIHLFSSAGKNIQNILSCLIWFLLDFMVHVYVTITVGSRFLGVKILLLFAVKTVTLLQESVSLVVICCWNLINSHYDYQRTSAVLKTNIPLLIPGWWRLCTDIRAAYACGCGNESVHILKRVWNPQL